MNKERELNDMQRPDFTGAIVARAFPSDIFLQANPTDDTIQEAAQLLIRAYDEQNEMGYVAMI